MKSTLALLCLTASLCGSAGVAAAADLPAPASTPTTEGPASPDQQASQAQPPAQQTNAPTPGLNRIGQALQNAGIDVHGMFIDQGIDDVSMGQRPGYGTNQALLLPAVDLDLEKIAHIPGGQIHLMGTFWMLKADVPGITSQIGGILGGYITSPTTTPAEFSLATYEQTLFNGALDIEGGRTNANRYFDTPNCLAFFSCFSPTISVDADIAPPPYAVWGGRVKYNMGPHAYVQAGAFEDNYLDAARTESVNFSTQDAVGTLIMAETGYHTDYSTDQHPRSIALGMFYDTAGAGTFKGTPFPYVPTSGRYPYNGGKGIYVSANQTVWTGAGAATGAPKSIAVYGHLSAAVAGPQPVDLDAYAGVVAQGLLPRQILDKVGFKVQYERLDSKEAAFETQARIASGGPDTPQSPNSFVMQINGYRRLTSWAGIQPDISYFINPDSYYVPFTNRMPRDGYMVGAQLLISLGQLLGTSTKPY